MTVSIIDEMFNRFLSLRISIDVQCHIGGHFSTLLESSDEFELYPFHNSGVI